MMNPKVSVIIPAYNAELYLRESMESILAQTFHAFELIIIDDGSTDRTADIALSFADPRVKLVRNEQNLGLAGVRNKGIREAIGQYIAWLDADDFSSSTRLEKQVRLLDENPAIGLCGTWVKTIGALAGEEWRYAVDPDVLKCQLVFQDPFATSSVMLRKTVLLDMEALFDLEYPPAEDYDLWERIAQTCKVTNIPEVLTYYRLHANQTSMSPTGLTKQQISVRKIQKRQLERLGMQADQAQRFLDQVACIPERFSADILQEIHAGLLDLVDKNKKMQLYDEKIFWQVLGDKWLALCQQVATAGFPVQRFYRQTPFHSTPQKIKICISAVMPKRLKHYIKCILGKK